MINKIKFLMLIFLIVNFISKECQGQSEQLKTFTLKEAKEYALSNNIQVANAKLDIKIAKEKIWETTAIGLPQISSELSYNQYLDIPTQLMPDFISPAVIGVNQGIFGLTPVVPIPEGDQFFEVQFGQKHNASGGITASQLIFNGEYIVGLRAAKIYKSLSEQGLEKTEKSIIETVSQTYYLVLVAIENRNILSKSLENIEKTLLETETMYNTGFIEETDLDQIKLTYTTIKNSLNSLNRQVEISYNLLKFQMGLDLNEKIELSDNIESLIKNSNSEFLSANNFVLENNIDYKLIETQEKLSLLSLRRQQAMFLPTISMFYSHQQNAMRNEFNFFNNNEKWFPTSIIGASMTIPIFGSGMKISKIKQAKLDFIKSENNKKLVAESLKMEYTQAKYKYTDALDNFLSEKTNLELAEKIYSKNTIKYAEGAVSSLELTQIQNQYLTTQSKYFQSIYNLLNAKLTLDKILNNY